MFTRERVIFQSWHEENFFLASSISRAVFLPTRSRKQANIDNGLEFPTALFLGIPSQQAVRHAFNFHKLYKYSFTYNKVVVRTEMYEYNLHQNIMYPKNYVEYFINNFFNLISNEIFF